MEISPYFHPRVDIALSTANSTRTSPIAALHRRFTEVRRRTTDLTRTLETEDFVVQSMPDASPTRWHLAHTTWFFETFVLSRSDAAYRPFHPLYRALFNSYYNAIGEPFPRDRRGTLSRPTVRDVMAYRAHVDREIDALLDRDLPLDPDLASALELGMHHEQQHQELILTDIKHALSLNPLSPAYIPSSGAEQGPRGDGGLVTTPTLGWKHYTGGVHRIGVDPGRFSFDNEGPPHEVLLRDFELADRMITNAEYREFIEDGGYRRPELWLSDGWDRIHQEGWSAPLYWNLEDGGEGRQFTLTGSRPITAAEPTCHVSFFEADAFARWASARLPTEHEWEVAAEGVPVRGNLAESQVWHTAPVSDPNTGEDAAPAQLFGDAWEWTSSPYSAYPGYRASAGALGEYNGKFMCNQFVLRGGSHATPTDHLRRTYRNFHAPGARWQFTGIRLAR